jgi:chemotaxis response regulator CheB
VVVSFPRDSRGLLRILIADNDADFRSRIRRLLFSQTVWVCVEAVDGQDAVDKSKDFIPDLVLMDASMPRMNGL